MDNEMKGKLSMIPIPVMYLISLASVLYLSIEGIVSIVIFLGLGFLLSLPFFYLVHCFSNNQDEHVTKQTGG